MRSRILMWVALSVAVGSGAWLVPSRGMEAQGQGSGARPLADLAGERVKLAKEVIKGLEEELKLRKGHEEFDEITRWFRRVAETRHELGGEKEEVIADLKAYVDRMKVQILGLEARKEAGLASTFDIDTARYELLEAETWLAQAGGPIR